MAKKVLLGLGGLGLVIALAAGVMLGPALFPPTDIEAGIAQGAAAPTDMELRDMAGKTTSLRAISGEKGTVLLLVRSVDWCPFCINQVKSTAPLTAKLEERGYTLASLSYDAPETLAEFAAEHSIPFVLLSDEQSAFIDAVGLRDPQYPSDHQASGVPYASVLVLARDGTVSARFVSQDYRQRPSNDDILAMVESAS